MLGQEANRDGRCRIRGSSAGGVFSGLCFLTGRLLLQNEVANSRSIVDGIAVPPKKIGWLVMWNKRRWWEPNGIGTGAGSAGCKVERQLSIVEYK